MNGPKLRNDIRFGIHNHIHGVRIHPHGVDLAHVQEVIGKDGVLKQDHSADRASFQGRFRKTSFGDFKNRPGHGPEMVEAQIEDHEREDIKIEQAAQAILEVTEAAAEAGVILETEIKPLDEEIDLHRLADDGGPVHE